MVCDDFFQFLEGGAGEVVAGFGDFAEQVDVLVKTGERKVLNQNVIGYEIRKTGVQGLAEGHLKQLLVDGH